MVKHGYRISFTPKPGDLQLQISMGSKVGFVLNLNWVCKISGNRQKGPDSEKSLHLLRSLTRESLSAPSMSLNIEIPCVGEDAEQVLPSHGLQVRHKVSSSISENTPAFSHQKPWCILQSSLRPKAKHPLPRLGTKYMWNKNDGGGLPPASGVLICLSLSLQSHSWAVLFVVYWAKVLYWYAKRLQSNA